MIGAEIIAKTLKSLGVKNVFIFPGGTVAPLLDALIKEGVEYLCMVTEQGAGFAAIGAAKITGFPQVVMVTSGPGATNLVTPVADAYFDSVPLLVITGQVGTSDINLAKKIRQTSFQEVDSVGIYTSITKQSRILGLDQDISSEITTAFNLANSGRKGPVHIDLPMNVQRTEAQQSSKVHKSDEKVKGDKLSGSDVKKIHQLILQAKRPLVLAGNGIYLADAVDEFRSFILKYKIPVVTSLPGMGVLPAKHPLLFSFVGHTGEHYANLALYHSDLLLVLGARLDLRQTGTELEVFKSKKIVRVDIDNNELEFGRIKTGYNFNLNLKDFFAVFNKAKYSCRADYAGEWLKKIKAWRDEFDSRKLYEKYSLSMHDIIHRVDKVTRGKKVIVSTGVGIHQQLACRYFSFDHPRRRWLTSAGHGTMGFDIPASIGAQISITSGHIGIVFVGDGSFQMNLQELAVIKQFKLPIKIFVLDNKRLGIVSQFQLLNWKKDPTTGDKINPSFSKIGKAYGIDSFDIRKKKEIPEILRKVFSDLSPAVVHCHTDQMEDVLPMLLAKQKLNQMYPYEGETNL